METKTNVDVEGRRSEHEEIVSRLSRLSFRKSVLLIHFWTHQLTPLQLGLWAYGLRLGVLFRLPEHRGDTFLRNVSNYKTVRGITQKIRINIFIAMKISNLIPTILLILVGN
jgi:hypothetical protein